MDEHFHLRSCLPCTACCEGWLSIDQEEVQAQLGKPCVHCSHQKCSIYASRPVNPCRSFSCAWRQKESMLDDAMRPDLSGVIVVMDRLLWRNKTVVMAIPTGEKIPEKSMTYLLNLFKNLQMNMLFVRFLLHDGAFTGASRLSAYGEAEFVEDMKNKYSDGTFVW